MRENEGGVSKGRTKGSDIPTIGENSVLGRPTTPGALPPLPSFSTSLNPAITKVVVVVNGTEREAVVDHTGRIQLKAEAREYYSIASDDDRQSLPRFGEGGMLLPLNSPFSPEAASPFGEVAATPERSSPVEELVTAQPQVPPPPPPPDEFRSRRRSPSPKTLPPRRSSSKGLGFSPINPGGTKVPLSTPPPSPPAVSHETAGSVPRHVPDDDRDCRPGERTMWELPKLGAISETACLAVQ